MEVILRVRDTVSGAQYWWYDAGGVLVGTGAAVTVVAERSTRYVVEGRTGTGCSGWDTVEVEVGSQLGVQARGDTSVCKGSPVELRVEDAASDAEYVWYRGGQEIGRGVSVWVVVEDSGVYVVRGQRGVCSGSDSVEVRVYPGVAVRSWDVTVCRGQEAELAMEGTGERCWWEDASGVVIGEGCRYRGVFAADARVVGVMENAYGCRGRVEVAVSVEEPVEVEVWVEPAELELGAGERGEVVVYGRSRRPVGLEGAVRVRVESQVADVEGSRSDGKWQLVERGVDGVVVDQGGVELVRVGMTGVVGGEHVGQVVVELDSVWCGQVSVRGGQILRRQVCVDALRGVRLVTPVQIVQRGDEVVVEGEGEGVEEVRVYGMVGVEVGRSRGGSVRVGGLASGVYVVRYRVRDRWESRLVWVLR
jgi:hypothetical protein